MQLACVVCTTMANVKEPSEEGSLTRHDAAITGLPAAYFCRLTDSAFGVRRPIRNCTAFFSMR